jgi:hypothetical protein
MEEADEFISGLNPKTIRKIFYSIDLAEQTNDPKLLKSFKMISGSFEQNTQAFKSDF